MHRYIILIIIFLSISGLIVASSYKGYMILQESKEEEGEISIVVNAITHLNSKVDKNVARIIASRVLESCKKHEQSPLFVVSLIFRESGFRPLITSKSGCIGLMQINPKAHPKKISEYKHNELYHIGINIDIGCKILKEYSKKNKTPKEILKKYFGAYNKGYIEDVLNMFTELALNNKELML